MRTTFITGIIIITSIAFGFSQDISGVWRGAIKLGEKSINFTFKIKKKDSTYSTSIDIPTQRLEGIKASLTSISKHAVVIDVSNVGMIYKGQLNSDGTKINGTISESVNSFPLVLKRSHSAEISKITRPQEPLKPYPYTEETVRFFNKKSGITLVGTLTKPYGDSRFPVAILISGSGPQDRDETIAQHKPFLVIADYLTRQGVAVLRYDDRGFGKSSGDYSKATTKDLSLDVLSAIAFLKKRKDIDVRNIGLIGHSEGGIIAPLVANESKDVAYIISLAGTGISGKELIVKQSIALRPFPVPDEAAYEKTIRKSIEIASQDKKMDVIRAELKDLYDLNIVPILINLGVSNEKIDRIINGFIEIRTTPWMRYFYNYNPATEFEKLSCPVLSLNGSKDTQVEAKTNQEGIRRALMRGGNKDYKIIELEGLNHLFQACETGAITEYSKIEETFSPKALQVISNWVLNHIN